jgi:hypothetical protein
MASTLTGEWRETCSCNMHCPCWMGIKELMLMDQGYCGSTNLFRIQAGNLDGVDLGGLTLAVAVLWPGPTLFDGNGTGRLYIDEAANPAQRAKLEEIFLGKKGGAMEIMASLTPTWLPTQYTKINIQEEGDSVSAEVGAFGQIRSRLLKNAAGLPMKVANVGFTDALQFDNSEGTLAPSDGSQWSDPDMAHPFPSKSGTAGYFTWNFN